MLAIRSDEELRKLFKDADFCQAGSEVVVHGAKTNKKKKQAAEDSDSDWLLNLSKWSIRFS